jgi:hypothetical protein
MISYTDLKEEVMMAFLLIMLQINSDILQLKFSRELENISKDSIIMTQPVWQVDMDNIVSMVNLVKILLEESYQDTKIWSVKNFVKEEEFMTRF